MSYEYLDHIADAGVRACGDSLEDLFTDAAKGLISLMIDVEDIKTTKTSYLQVNASSAEDLLYNWLKELLSISYLNRTFYGRFDVNIDRENEEFTLNAELSGESIESIQGSLGPEVKGITYQGLEVSRTDDRWSCRFVVDV